MFWLALAGGCGASARFIADGLLGSRLPARWPLATLIINVTGSFLLGLLTGLGADHAEIVMVLGTGFLGGFTTFSTASVELVRLVRSERTWTALALALSMPALAVAAAATGLALGAR